MKHGDFIFMQKCYVLLLRNYLKILIVDIWRKECKVRHFEEI